MKQNPILTIAQNLIKRDLSIRGKRVGISKEQIQYWIEILTMGNREKFELNSIMRFMDLLEDQASIGKNIPVSAIYTAILETTKSDKIKSMVREVQDKDPKHPDGIFGICIPYDLNTRYRKMSSKVYDYITSLGEVSADLCRTAVEDLSKLIDPITGLFHDMILIDTSKGPFVMEAFVSKADRIRIITRFASTSVVHTYLMDKLVDQRDVGAELKNVLDVVKHHVNTGDDRDLDSEIEEKAPDSDPLAFYINIYLAEKTNHLVPGKEPNYVKKKVIEICRAENKPYDPKDKSVRYEYIDVSEDRWKQHIEFKNAVHRKMEGDRKWYKSHWWRKAHYMKAGKDKHLAFVEATICHRSCGTIEEEDVQVVQVLR